MNSIKINEITRKKNLDLGRKIRHQQLKEFRDNLPPVTNLIDGGYLNLEKWFDKYQFLINFGCRAIQNISKKNNKIRVSYTNYANSKKKLFTVDLPRKIKLNNFSYFFGLWAGDKISGGRIGVINKNQTINKITEKYLEKIYQKQIYVLYIGKHSPIPNVKFDKIIKINHKKNGYAVSVHATNGILRSFFRYLEKNLQEFLKLIPNKNVFFAGLFDAEGNIFLEDGCYRWSCKNKEQVEIYKKIFE